MTESLARDWVALWRSELTAMAADRELRESWAAMAALWAGAANAALATMRAAHDAPAGATVALQPARPAAVVAASDFGLDEVERLHRRIAELEHRLATIERGGG